MAQRVIVIPYDYSDSLRFLSPSSECLSDEVRFYDMTTVQCACRLVAKWLGVVQGRTEDFEQFRHLADVGFQELSFYIANFAVMAQENVILVPVPGLKNWQMEIEYAVDKSLLISRFQQATSSDFLQSALQKRPSAWFLPFPIRPPADFAVFHFNNYPPFKGVGESWYAGLFQKPGESWAHYQIPEGNFPSEETLCGLRGIVLTGGRYSAYDTSLPWLSDIQRLIQRCMDRFRRMKIVGICLGAQLVAESLGGKVAAGPQGLVYKLEEIATTKEMQEMFPSALSHYNLPENHKDEVIRLPPDSVLLGSSPSCANEIFAVSNRALLVQGHPNYIGAIQKTFHAGRMLQRGTISRQTYEEIGKDYECRKNHAGEMIKLMETFLKTPI